MRVSGYKSVNKQTKHFVSQFSSVLSTRSIDGVLYLTLKNLYNEAFLF